MQQADWYLRFLAVLLTTVLVSGCANLGAVRDFATSSATMTGYEAVTEHYVSSADRQLADLPSDKRFEGARANLLALKASTEQDRETLLKLHAVTTGYMAALAQLAGQQAYAVSPEMLQVSGAIATSGSLNINADHVSAHARIAARVADWSLAARQVKDVRQMVRQNGADMDKLLEAMQLATQTYGIVQEQEIQSYDLVADYRQAQWSAALPGDVGLTPERREVISTVLRRSTLADRAAQQQALEAQRAAAAGLERVREAHEVLVSNLDRLNAKDVRAILRQAASDLKAIRQNISDL